MSGVDMIVSSNKAGAVGLTGVIGWLGIARRERVTMAG
ncbi:hypothetical protein FRUB_09185 [Fimbriiglobus ruber]|uniref:Uncharacterized protein n=1 Tax=Fimbriiglobus ruber TaxID=1908690 RepID=A0A225D560_9BACT|nr:hypothetical protein FRUB_09185 [Fimbriiglobus ruber]